MFAESESVLWQSVSRVARDEGLELYDLERVTGGLRVFIAPIFNVANANCSADSHDEAEGADRAGLDLADASKQAGVDSEDCARLCRRLVTFFSVEGAGLGVGNEPNLEVSSPGVNRHLRLGSHFLRALGEKIKVQYKSSAYDKVVDSQGAVDIKRTVVGLLENVDDRGISIRDTETVFDEASPGEDGVLQIKFEEIVKARVEFNFAGPVRAGSPSGGAVKKQKGLRH